MVHTHTRTHTVKSWGVSIHSTQKYDVYEVGCVSSFLQQMSHQISPYILHLCQSVSLPVEE
jgi:hypothetical protein